MTARKSTWDAASDGLFDPIDGSGVLRRSRTRQQYRGGNEDETRPDQALRFARRLVFAPAS